MRTLGFPGGASGKEPTCQCRWHLETWVPSLGWEDLLEEGMATHHSILAWKIPWTEEPGGLQSIASQRVRHDWSNLAHTHTENSNGIRNLVTNASDSANIYVSDWSRSTSEYQSTAYWPQVCCRIHCNALLWRVRNGIFPATSVNKGCHKSSVIATTADGELVSHEETQEGKNTCSNQTAATPYGEPWGDSGYEDTGYWPLVGEVPIEGMISVSQDSCIFLYIEKH